MSNNFNKKRHQFLNPLNITFSEGTTDAKLPTEMLMVPKGSWPNSSRGDLEFTDTDIQDFVTNWERGLRVGLPIDLGHSMDAAAGWIDSLEARPDGLWGTNISWTPLGIQSIIDQVYRFFSPEIDRVHIDEETGEVYRNVFIGGGLVNRPFFKGLPALTFSETGSAGTADDKRAILFVASENMNIQDILKKAPADLTTDEKAFLAEHRAELSAEQLTQFGVVEAPATGEVIPPVADETIVPPVVVEPPVVIPPVEDKLEAGEKKVTISFAEKQKYDDAIEKVTLMAQELDNRDAETAIVKLLMSEKGGVIKLDDKDKVKGFYLTLSKAQRDTFSEIMTSIPSPAIFKEIGVGGHGNVNDSPAGDQLIAKAKELAKTENLQFSEALTRVKKENPELNTQYREELSNK